MCFKCKCQFLVQAPRKAVIIERKREAKKLCHEKQLCTELFIYLFFICLSKVMKKGTNGSAASVVILKRTSWTADEKRGK